MLCEYEILMPNSDDSFGMKVQKSPKMLSAVLRTASLKWLFPVHLINSFSGELSSSDNAIDAVRNDKASSEKTSLARLASSKHQRRQV